MRIFPHAALFAAIALSGCASRPPSARHPSTSISSPKSASVAAGKSNRFHMTQNGHAMSADDFDAWMRARGIRVAKGPQAGKRSAKPRPSVQAQARPAPKRR